MRQLFFPLVLLLAIPSPVFAGPIALFPETANPEAAPCYFKTADGRAFDLSSMCGKSEALSRSRNQNQPNQNQPNQNQSNSSATVNSSLSNPGFRAAINANPGSPFGNNPALAECYVVDTEGHPCQP